MTTGLTMYAYKNCYLSTLETREQLFLIIYQLAERLSQQVSSHTRTGVPDKLMYLSQGGCEASGRSSRKAGRGLWMAAWQREEGDSRTGCLGTLLQEDDSSISQALIKQSGVTISGSQPTQCPSCSDKVRQAIHQSGDRDLDPRSPASMETSQWPVTAGMCGASCSQVVGGTKMAVKPLWRNHA